MRRGQKNRCGSSTPAWTVTSSTTSPATERQGKTPEQFADEILRQSKPVRRTDKQLRDAAFSAASTTALDKWCKVPLTYGERVELIVVGTQVGRSRLEEALNALDENIKEMGASEFCLRLEKRVRGKVEW